LRKNGLDDPCVFKYHFKANDLGIRMRAKISIVFLSISLIASFGLSSNQAFAGNGGFLLPESCDDCDALEELFLEQCTNDVNSQNENGIVDCFELEQVLRTCAADFCRAIGGAMIQMETTSVLAAGAQYTAAWMIPVLISGIGFAIVIARKF